MWLHSHHSPIAQHSPDIRERLARVATRSSDDQCEHAAGDRGPERQPDRRHRTQPRAQRGEQLHVTPADSPQREDRQKQRQPDRPTSCRGSRACGSPQQQLNEQCSRSPTQRQYIWDTAPPEIGQAGREGDNNGSKRRQGHDPPPDGAGGTARLSTPDTQLEYVPLMALPTSDQARTPANPIVVVSNAYSTRSWPDSSRKSRRTRSCMLGF